MSTIWSTVKIGAGGFITGLDIASDGSSVIRTDTYGGYRWSGSTWVQLVTIQSMPAAQAGLEKDAGVNDVRIAPSNVARFYMNYNGQMFRSDNSGATWTLLSNYATVTWSANDTNIKTFGPYIAIDPANADVVYASTPVSGLRTSIDAGATWSTVAAVGTAITIGGTGGGHLIKFDPSSSVIGNRTQGIYVSTYGTGVFRSINGGTSWAITPSTPTTHVHMDIGSDGVLYLTPNDGSDNLRIYNGTSWSTKSVGSLGNPIQSVAVDPADANKITCVNQAGALSYSSDHAANFTGFQNSPAGITRTATDIPWLGWTNENFMSASDIRFDPSQSNKLYFSEGIGVWTTSPGPNVGTSVAYVSQSAGIEQLVANDVVSPPNGKPVLSFWDRPAFYVNDPTVYPSTHGMANPQANAIISGWSIDYASTDPTVIAGIGTFGANESGFSTDGGQNWTAFATVPAGVPGTFFNGCFAASSATNFMWVPFINCPHIYFTTNQGTTWTASTVPTVPITGETGWSNTFSNSLDRQIVCADRVTANEFYIYNIGTSGGDTSFAGIWVSTDSGANFSRVFSGLIGTYNIDSFNATLKSVPGNAGHLFFTGGQVGGSTSGSFWRSTDGGASWVALTGITEVYAFGFGKARVSGGYPAVYVAGFVGGTTASDWGIWRSEDGDQAVPTWTRLGDGYPLGNFSQIKTMEGDSNTFGTVYIGTIGAGFLMGTEAPSSGGFFVKTSGASSPRVLLFVRP